MRLLVGVAFVVGGLVLIVWLSRVRRKFEPPNVVSPQWLTEHRYDRRGDRRSTGGK
jgi:hypothetical protein